MGLRDRKTTRVRERGFNGHSPAESRAMYRRAAGAVGRVLRMGGDRMRAMLRFDYAGILIRDGRDDGREHFAETPVGGIAITFGALGGLILVLWIGSLL